MAFVPGTAMNMICSKNRPLLGKPGLDSLKELGVRTLIAFNWTPAMAIRGRWSGRPISRRWSRPVTPHGMRVIPYIGYQISEKAPEFPWVKDEVVLFPPATNADKYPNTKPQMVSSVCLRSIWQDALVDYVSRMMDEFDIDGLYLDSANMPFPCMNALHGCGARRADGTRCRFTPFSPCATRFAGSMRSSKARKPTASWTATFSTA